MWSQFLRTCKHWRTNSNWQHRQKKSLFFLHYLDSELAAKLVKMVNPSENYNSIILKMNVHNFEGCAGFGISFPTSKIMRPIIILNHVLIPVCQSTKSWFNFWIHKTTFCFSFPLIPLWDNACLLFPTPVTDCRGQVSIFSFSSCFLVLPDFMAPPSWSSDKESCVTSTLERRQHSQSSCHS